MNKNSLIVLVILVLVIIGIIAAFAFSRPTVDLAAPVTPSPGFSTGTQQNQNPPAASPATQTPSQNQTSTAPVAKTVTVVLTDQGFSPATVTIATGDTVTFVNNSSRSFWPASDDHPTHTKYSEFDPRQGIPAGGRWSFTFNKPGTWNYHDHMRASERGTVIVQ